MSSPASQSQAAPQPGAGKVAGDAEASPTPPEAVGPSESRSAVLGWTSGDRWFARVLGAIIVALLLVHWGRVTGRGGPAIEIQRLETAENRFQLDINRATWVEWMQLEGIGETLARRIVDDREQNGPFGSVDDIQRVHGIGPKTVDALRPWLTCADCPSRSASPDDDER